MALIYSNQNKKSNLEDLNGVLALSVNGSHKASKLDLQKLFKDIKSSVLITDDNIDEVMNNIKSNHLNSGVGGKKGNDGPQGYQGLEGYQGSKGLQGFSGRLVEEGHFSSHIQWLNPKNKGDRGSQGSQGYQGYQGPRGRNGENGRLSGNYDPNSLEEFFGHLTNKIDFDEDTNTITINATVIAQNSKANNYTQIDG